MDHHLPTYTIYHPHESSFTSGYHFTKCFIYPPKSIIKTFTRINLITHDCGCSPMDHHLPTYTTCSTHESSFFLRISFHEHFFIPTKFNYHNVYPHHFDYPRFSMFIHGSSFNFIIFPWLLIIPHGTSFTYIHNMSSPRIFVYLRISFHNNVYLPTKINYHIGYPYPFHYPRFSPFTHGSCLPLS